MQLPSSVAACQSFWTVSKDLILIELFNSDHIHTSIGMINLTSLEFVPIHVTCGVDYGPSFTIYNGLPWYLCKHNEEIRLMQYEHPNQHTQISTYGPISAPVSKVTGLCTFGEKILVWVLKYYNSF